MINILLLLQTWNTMNYSRNHITQHCRRNNIHVILALSLWYYLWNKILLDWFYFSTIIILIENLGILLTAYHQFYSRPEKQLSWVCTIIIKSKFSFDSIILRWITLFSKGSELTQSVLCNYKKAHTSTNNL